ncbi:MAG: translation initiation factor IF-2 [Clostridia bacterium]|nr:translation initiation factor IF-2 [Clostridia bacterium]
MASENNNSLNNLKTIHKLQMGGELQELLRDIRSSRSMMDEFMNNLSRIISATKNQSNVQDDIDTKSSQKNDKDEVLKPEVVVDDEMSENLARIKMDRADPKSSDASTFLNQYTNKTNKSDFKNNYRQSQNMQNNKAPYGNKTDNRQFNKPYQGQNSKPINYTAQRTFNNQGDKFRQFGDQKNRFNNNQKPFGAKPFGVKASNGFAPSKANAFKSFEPLEDSRVLAQPEKTFGGKKAPVKNQYDEKKQMSKKSLMKKGFIVDNSYNDDEDGIRMGSRKLVRGKKKEEKVFVAPAIENAVITTENVSVKTLSEKTGKPVTEIIKKLMLLGIMATINSTIDYATAELVADELGVKLEQKIEKSYEEQLQETSSQSSENAIKRPPVVTVMGHVDHGKTSLLDAIRKTNVVSGEAGGITQKIGAYQVSWNGEKITFIDTPGHAAFTSMRARGAKVTDIAILVVAADDGIMPQTKEAIAHIKAANCPMIVAINKMDKPEANLERVKEQLAENGVLPEEWGGDTILVPISAKQGVGIDKLLETILLVAEMQELKADPDQTAIGTVIEAELDKNRGPIATILVQNGTLKIGDSVMSGITFGKVRAMFDENGKPIKSASPSTPVSVLGLDDVPNAGDQVYAVSEKLSKQVIQERINKIKAERANSTSGVSLDDFMDRVNEGKLKTLNLIIKADVQGSVEALKQTLSTLKNEEAKVVCIHSGAGPVTESDVILAEASDAIIINFNLKLAGKIESFAESRSVQIKSYKVIYECVDEINKALSGMLSIKYEDVVIGHAEVRVMFKLSSAGIVCGSYVKDGKITRNSYVRVFRGEEKILETQVEALKIQKDDKAEVAYGYECGIKLKDSTGVAVGDTFEVYEKVEVKRS